MKLQIKELMKHYNVNTKPIILALTGLCFLTVVLAATMIASAQNLKDKNTSTGAGLPTKEAVAIQSVGTGDMHLAVVEKLDTENKQITLFDVEQQNTLVLTYTGGSNITDKYDQIISMSQIELGVMVDASYDTVDYRLVSMNISKRAWEYSKVNNLSINQTDRIMKIAKTKYKYTEDIFVLDGDDQVPVDNLAEQDVLTVWGYEETIWSITVTTGHGTVKLEDYEDFLGNTISIGYESMLQITEDFAVSVREGTFNLTVENGQYTATKSVTVIRDQVTYASLADLGPIGLRLCEVTFDITPFGADLSIDGKPVAYSDPVELTYGKHTVKASLGGYTTYSETIDIDSEGKIIKIDLPEASSNQEVAVTQTDTVKDPDTSGNTTTDTAPSSTDNNDSDTGTEDDTEYSSENTEFILNDGDSLDSDHTIYIKSPSNASVYMDGQYMGTAPCKFKKIVGNHVLTFIQEGYETTSYTIDVEDNKQDAIFAFSELTQSP